MTPPPMSSLPLASLPEPDLPPGLWPDLQARHQALFRRRRRVGAGLALGGAAVLALGLLHAPRQMDPGQLATQAAPATEVQAMHAAGAPVRVLDQQLQDAYARNAGQAELDALWHARQAALQDAGNAPVPYPI